VRTRAGNRASVQHGPRRIRQASALVAAPMVHELPGPGCSSHHRSRTAVPAGSSRRWHRRQRSPPRRPAGVAPARSGSPRRRPPGGHSRRREHHHHLRRRRGDLRPGHPHRRGTRTGQHRLATGSLQHLWHPVPAVERRIAPLQGEHPGPLQPLDAAWTPASRSRSPATTSSARSGTPAALPTRSTPSRTSSSELGSGDITSAWQPRMSRAWLLCPEGTAQTAHRSWDGTRSWRRSWMASMSSR
jgi:hypothetical protein